MNYGKIKITEDNVDGIESYILVEQIDSKMYYAIVIDKENKLIMKYGESLNGVDYIWTNYKYSAGNVTDDDVKMKNWEEYQIFEIDKNYLEKFE